MESALNVDAGQFVSEFLVALGVVDVFAQLRSLCGGNPSTDVATIAPNLMLVVGADPASSAGIWERLPRERAQLTALRSSCCCVDAQDSPRERDGTDEDEP